MLLLRRPYIFLVWCVGIAFVIASILWINFLYTPLTVIRSIVFYVPSGSSIDSVAATLKARKIISSHLAFIFLAWSKGVARSLKTGEYQLDPGMMPGQLLNKLAEGKVILRRATIVEGWTLQQLIASINSNPYLAHTIVDLSPIDFAKEIGAMESHLEGSFYPDTYLFAAGVPDIVILKKAFLNMQRKLIKLWQGRAKNLPYHDPYSALIVASLIEKETARPEERQKIAGVIVRRLQHKMRLQIDASVIYGLGALYTGRLTKEDLNKDTPYNTYLHAGLPPSPIAMPSLLSIFAALHPESGGALYYVARGDGSHEFTTTLEGHHEAIKKFMREPLKN